MQFYKNPGKLRGIGKIQYPSRVLGIYLGAAVYMVNQYEAGIINAPVNYIMLSIALTYPHIILYIYWKSDSNNKVEAFMLLVDAFFSGMILPWMGFNLILTFIMPALTAAGTMVAKGFKHFLKGLLAIGLGILFGMAVIGFDVQFQSHNGPLLIISFSIFVVIYIILFAFAANRFVLQIIKIKRKVAKQQELIEQQHNDIIDSINYAKRIQTAILPSDEFWKMNLPDSFVFYLPKDVVAGDFYWMRTNEDTVYFAAADCTGHGVPGAMVSVVCNNGLNRSIREFDIDTPGLILDKVRELVVEELSASNKEVKDGMDIALCSLKMRNENEASTHSQGSTHTLKYAGAHNPLWIIRNGASQVEEIKANKEPIGQFEGGKSFTSHEVDLNKGDQIYIFSDGFADQFGGEDNKKYKSKRFKQFLLSNSHLTMSEQKEALHREFLSWKGEMEQLDDICVIGVRI